VLLRRQAGNIPHSLEGPYSEHPVRDTHWEVLIDALYRRSDNALNFFECWTDDCCMIHFSFRDDIGILYSRNQCLHHCGEKDLCVGSLRLDDHVESGIGNRFSSCLTANEELDLIGVHEECLSRISTDGLNAEDRSIAIKQCAGNPLLEREIYFGRSSAATLITKFSGMPMLTFSTSSIVSLSAIRIGL
jgi:hypothetical protein